MPTVPTKPRGYATAKRQKKSSRTGFRKVLTRNDEWKVRLTEIAEAIEVFVDRHPLGTGIAVAAVGAALIAVGAVGLKAEITAELLAAAMPKVFGSLGAAGGAALGLLGAAGVAIGGFAFGVPALAIGAAGAWILGQMGISAGELLHSVFGASLSNVIGDVGMIGLGAYLLAWGFDRIARDSRVDAILARVRTFFNEFVDFQKNALRGIAQMVREEC